MCDVCRKILTKLVSRGLVSCGNVLEQLREIKQEREEFLNKEMSKLTPQEIEEFNKVISGGQIH